MLAGPGEALAKRRMAWFEGSTRRTFNPASIGITPVGWWDFGDASTLFTNTGRTTPVANDGDAIAGVTDKSGTGNHLTQATAGSRPTYKVAQLNGRSAAQNDGGDSLATGNVTYAQPNTIIMLAKHGLAAASKPLIDGVGGGRNLVTMGAGPVWQIYAGNVLSGGTSDTTRRLFVAKFHGAASFLYVDGGAANIAAADAGAQSLGAASAITLFTDGVNFIANGSLAYEYVIYNAALTLAQINTVAGGMASKWSHTWTTAV